MLRAQAFLSSQKSCNPLNYVVTKEIPLGKKHQLKSPLLSQVFFQRPFSSNFLASPLHCQFRERDGQLFHTFKKNATESLSLPNSKPYTEILKNSYANGSLPPYSTFFLEATFSQTHHCERTGDLSFLRYMYIQNIFFPKGEERETTYGIERTVAVTKVEREKTVCVYTSTCYAWRGQLCCSIISFFFPSISPFFHLFSTLTTSTFVIFLGSGVPVSSTSTFW